MTFSKRARASSAFPRTARSLAFQYIVSARMGPGLFCEIFSKASEASSDFPSERRTLTRKRRAKSLDGFFVSSRISVSSRTAAVGLFSRSQVSARPSRICVLISEVSASFLASCQSTRASSKRPTSANAEALVTLCRIRRSGGQFLGSEERDSAGRWSRSRASASIT